MCARRRLEGLVGVRVRVGGAQVTLALQPRAAAALPVTHTHRYNTWHCCKPAEQINQFVTFKIIINLIC